MSEAENRTKPIQKILFGSPGVGKSYSIKEIAQKQLNIEWYEATRSLKNTIRTVFHPEYTYSDFVGKLLPQTTEGNSVIYKYYEGHFLRALGLAYKYLIEGSNKNVLLVIDELNRGNAAAIFGSIFQLLDREDDGWSTYQVDLSELEIARVINLMGYRTRIWQDHLEVEHYQNQGFNPLNIFCKRFLENLLENNIKGKRVLSYLQERRIAIPSNLSIIATINTSDESIYYLDSAFKRRWDWEYVDAPGEHSKKYVPEAVKEVKLVIDDSLSYSWCEWVINLNEFIKFNYQSIRRIEDKQIGWWFLKTEDLKIYMDDFEGKLMFYLWDSVFSRDKKPLEALLSKVTNQKISLITFSDFTNLSQKFVEAIDQKVWESSNSSNKALLDDFDLDDIPI